MTEAKEPTAEAIAIAAGVTSRTLFRHFPDMDTLYATLAGDVQRRIADIMDEPFPSHVLNADWREQLDLVIQRRAQIYENLLPLYASSTWLRGPYAYSTSEQNYAFKRRRRRLREILPELISQDKDWFEAIDATLSIDFWMSLRRGQRLSVKRAEQVLKRAVHGLVTQ